jgi:hypothetical protein
MALSLRPRLARAQPIVQDAEKFLGDELLAVPTTVGGTAFASVPNGTRHAYITNLDATKTVILRLTDGTAGGNPDSTHGIPIGPGASLDLTCDPAKAKLLGVGGSVNVFANYFGEP